MKEILYKSTRSTEGTLKASEAILKGLADDGGLFVPLEIPALDVTVEELSKMTYQQVAYEVMKLYFTDFTEEELKNCINNAYDSKFDTEEIAPLAEVEGTYFLELFHGKTIAFKDMALSILPHLLTTSAKKNGVKNEIVILTATSGDTGKAAMAGFADVPGTRIIVFYPNGGVSPIQEKQMVTQKVTIHTLLQLKETLTRHRVRLRLFSVIKSLQKKWMKRDFSSHQLTQLTLDVLFHRWHIMYMLTQNYLQKEK